MSDPRAWLEAGKKFENVVLTGDLHFCTSKGGPIFDLQLKPMRMEQSSRLFRRFGNDRFLVVGLPSLEEKTFPSHLRKHGIRRRLIEWLVQEEHSYFGRIWRPFYVKGKSDRTKKVTDNQHGEIKHLVYFFATKGCDFQSSGEQLPRKGEAIDGHTPMNIADLWEWFCPRGQNEQKTACKMFSRMALGWQSLHAGKSYTNESM